VNDYSVPDYYVIDLRAPADFDAGHIKDAHNTTLANVLDEAANANGKDILVVCYSGQTAARATGVLRMKGYTAKTLKWGMSCWHNNFAGKWDAKAGDTDSDNWITTGEPPALAEFDAPELSVTGVTGEDIFNERIEAILDNDWIVSSTAVLDAPADYFINNKWSLDSWNAYGHIDGAYRIDEDLNIDGLKYLDPSKTMVTYCYTGQTSSITTAWLQVLGFENARSLAYGANSMAHTALVNGSAAGKSWKGAGSASEMNFGYYDSDGNYYPPEQ
jgi:rhodanese-related sulfurtransferase